MTEPGRHGRLPNGWKRRVGPRAWIIPDLWPEGHVPAFGGNYKAGKSTTVVDLLRALVVPGAMFLGHYPDVHDREAGTVRYFDEERGWLRISTYRPPGSVVVINVENPIDELVRMMEAAIPAEFRHRIEPVHLEDFGGPASFDLTVPANYDYWSEMLMGCEVCDGSDDWAPSVVIVDGVTRILQNNGKGTEHFGLWYAKFTQLLKQIGVTSGLAVFHNTMAGGHLMGGTESGAGPDGIWKLSRTDVDRPGSKRLWSVDARLIPEIALDDVPVELVDGKPILRPKAAKAEAMGESESEVEKWARLKVEWIREHGGATAGEVDEAVDAGSKTDNLAARSLAEERTWLRVEPCGPDCTVCGPEGEMRGRHNRKHYWAQAADN